MRVIVCGGRDYSDKAAVERVLDALHHVRPIRHLFHGNARGADSLAADWGTSMQGVSVHAVPANWAKYGRSAGPKRNQAMLGQSPDLVVAFPGGKGTADMINRARKAGVEVMDSTK